MKLLYLDRDGVMVHLYVRPRARRWGYTLMVRSHVILMGGRR